MLNLLCAPTLSRVNVESLGSDAPGRFPESLYRLVKSRFERSALTADVERRMAAAC